MGLVLIVQENTLTVIVFSWDFAHRTASSKLDAMLSKCELL